MNTGEKVFSTEQPLDVQQLLRNRLEAQPELVGSLEVSGISLYSQQTLPTFYASRAFEPIWVEQNDRQIHEMIEVIRRTYDHGLNPEHYHLSAIEQLWTDDEASSDMTAGEQTDLELLLTDAFLLIASHMIAGQLNPLGFDPRWFIVRDEVDYNTLLEQLADGIPATELIARVQPEHRRYNYLVEALGRYREISREGGWPRIDPGPTMREGDTGTRVEKLRERLRLAGDYSYVYFVHEAAPDSVFDRNLHDAVVRFQLRHGLEADGLVGQMSLTALNTPVERRISEVMVNLERWRWLNRNLGERHILVNIANFSVEVVEDGTTVLDMRAIVGRQYRQTPVFSSRMTYLVLSPFWNLPPGIVRNDIIPRIRNDAGYAAAQNIRIFEGWGANATEVQAENINWADTEAIGRYRFRQDPGPQNALGDVKFMFPNPYHVYLHDTPARELFGRTVRDFSSGCIRIDKPFELAEHLLAGDASWTPEQIRRVIQQRRERTVMLPEPYWVHILYWTAWAEPDGTIHFRNDIYGRDVRLLEAIEKQMQTPEQPTLGGSF